MLFVFKLGHLLFPCCLVALCVTSFIKEVNNFDALFHRVKILILFSLAVVVALDWHVKLILCALTVQHSCCCHPVSEVFVVVVLLCMVCFSQKLFFCCFPMLKFSYLNKLVKTNESLAVVCSSLFLLSSPAVVKTVCCCH